MNSKRLIVLAPVVALALAACGGSTGTTTPGATATGGGAAGDADCANAANFCIGLVTDIGKVDDKSFNQSAWEGAQKGAAAVGGFSKFIETTDTKDYAANIAQFTAKKYDVIITVGFLMADATAKAATANAETKFVGIDQGLPAENPPTNYASLVFPEDQAGYAAGFLAGKLTKTNKLGQVLGQEIPPVQKFAKGFEAGAKAANSGISVTTVYHAAGDTASGRA